MPPIRKAIACNQKGVDRIGIAEKAGFCVLFLDALLKSGLQLMDPGVLALISSQPDPKGCSSFHGFPERRGGLFRTSHACVASSGQAPS